MGVGFKENPVAVPAGIFENGLDKFLPENPPPVYVPGGVEDVDFSTMGRLKSFFGEVGDGFKAGAKGTVNGLTQSVVEFGTLGFVEYNGPFGLTEEDLYYGAGYSVVIAKTSGGILIGVATGGVASYANGACKAGTAMRVVGKVLSVRDMAEGGLDVFDGMSDIYQNGLTLENGIQVVSGAMSFKGGLDGLNTRRNCFTAGTQIVVGAEYDDDGVFVQYITVSIEDIQVGDLVYSYDTLTGEVSQNAVTAFFVRESDHINYLTVADENGHTQTIETTDGHPFWVVTDDPDLSRAARDVVDENGVLLYHENLAPGLNGYWVEAKDLREGDVFVGANGELSTLVSVERIEFEETIKVYNFEVADNHNYFIIAQVDDYGQTCILVHNATGYRVMSPEEYADASKGIFKDSDLVNGDLNEMGSKWMWDNPASAQKWKDFCEANGETGQVIAKLETKNPLSSYPHFDHSPEGIAYHVPIPEIVGLNLK